MPSQSGTLDESFAHEWQIEILKTPPLIAPARQYIYPQAAKELDPGDVELGALQILLRSQPGGVPVLATFALGFADPALPHGIWSCPNPKQLCAVAGGYAYIVQADQPGQWMQIPYRPVVSIHPAIEQNLLILTSFHKLMALGHEGQAWETGRLSWEGLRVTEIANQKIKGFGWDLVTDTEVAFAVDISTGLHTGGAGPK